jgi:hypothetical protein
MLDLDGIYLFVEVVRAASIAFSVRNASDSHAAIESELCHPAGTHTIAICDCVYLRAFGRPPAEVPLRHHCGGGALLHVRRRSVA